MFEPALPSGPADYRYIGQPANDGVIDLTPSNGFFDPLFRAHGAGPVVPGDEDFTYASYDHLKKRIDMKGSARWHVWCAEPGIVEAEIYLTVPQSDVGHEWTIRFGDHVRTLTAVGSDSSTPQPQVLRFEIEEAATCSFVIDCHDDLPAPETLIHMIRLKGSAVQNAKLIRAFRRPVAKHVGFEAPATCLAPSGWIFETEQMTATGYGYSPI